MSSFRTFLSIRKRIRQRATRYSLLVVILLFGLFLEAYMHNFNLVYIALFFVFAAAFAAGPMGLRNLGYLDAEFAGCDRLFARREGRCHFQITNRGTMSAWAVELHTALGKTTVREIPAHAHIRTHLRFTPPVRGKAEMGPCRVQSLFPLATVRFELLIAKNCPLLVYPEPKGEPLQSFLSRRRAPFGDEMDFNGIARYSGVESASRIHWPSVAKGEAAVKTFEHEQRTETLDFDFVSCGSNDEERLSQLTLWVLECEQVRLPFTIKMPKTVLDSKQESIDAILTYLALYS